MTPLHQVPPSGMQAIDKPPVLLRLKMKLPSVCTQEQGRHHWAPPLGPWTGPTMRTTEDRKGPWGGTRWGCVRRSSEDRVTPDSRSASRPATLPGPTVHSTESLGLGSWLRVLYPSSNKSLSGWASRSPPSLGRELVGPRPGTSKAGTRFLKPFACFLVEINHLRTTSG